MRQLQENNSRDSLVAIRVYFKCDADNDLMTFNFFTMADDILYSFDFTKIRLICSTRLCSILAPWIFVTSSVKSRAITLSSK